MIRLELLKLTYTHGRDAAEAVERAKVLEAFVLAGAADRPDKGSGSGTTSASTNTLSLPKRADKPNQPR